MENSKMALRFENSINWTPFCDVFKIMWSNPSYTEKVFFRVSQMCIWIVPIERARKTDL